MVIVKTRLFRVLKQYLGLKWRYNQLFAITEPIFTEFEISLILDCKRRGKGFGSRAVAMILETGFGCMGLKTIYGECYECNPAIEFWKKVTENHGGYCTLIPRRKLWQGQLYDALHFSIWR